MGLEHGTGLSTWNVGLEYRTRLLYWHLKVNSESKFKVRQGALSVELTCDYTLQTSSVNVDARTLPALLYPLIYS